MFTSYGWKETFIKVNFTILNCTRVYFSLGRYSSVGEFTNKTWTVWRSSITIKLVLLITKHAYKESFHVGNSTSVSQTSCHIYVIVCGEYIT